MSICKACGNNLVTVESLHGSICGVCMAFVRDKKYNPRRKHKGKRYLCAMIDAKTKVYEQGKAKIIALDLPSDQYESAIRDLAKRLKI